MPGCVYEPWFKLQVLPLPDSSPSGIDDETYQHYQASFLSQLPWKLRREVNANLHQGNWEHNRQNVHNIFGMILYNAIMPLSFVNLDIC